MAVRFSLCIYLNIFMISDTDDAISIALSSFDVLLEDEDVYLFTMFVRLFITDVLFD